MMGWIAGKPPSHLGGKQGQLAPCPHTPNCVSSQEQGKAWIPPLSFTGEPGQAMLRLKLLLEALPRVRVTETSASYLRAEAASPILGFVDDLEFLMDPAGQCIQVRSAARRGRNDFGVNRRRIEAVRDRFS